MSTARILVVDDEADIRDLVQEILSEEGYAVEVAANAAEARAACARQAPDLVLLDIWMPDTDGISLLREWQQSAGVECYLTVDRAGDGWDANVGVVGSLFKKPGVQVPVNNTIAFVCGPPVMFNTVIAELIKRGLRDDCIISTLERHMKCGIGKCQHCAIGRTLVCNDGPVYTYRQIKTLGEQI